MRLSILAVGRMKNGPERELYNRYADRITKSGKSLHLIGLTLHEIAESRAQETNKRKNEEAENLLKITKGEGQIILLDEQGKDLNSHNFSKLISGQQNDGCQELFFAIGGADGHGDALKQAAAQKIRLGAMTLPHQLARIVLIEQIYRSITLMSGHPYHRD